MASVHFLSSDGLWLQGRYQPGPGRSGAVICHPHPEYGGSMDDAVVRTVEAAFRGHTYATLAFNFRGVGGSEGSFAQGVGERNDVLGAIAFLAKSLGGTPGLLALAGHSFGAGVAAHVAAEDPRVGLYVGIAPPCAFHDFRFLASATCRLAFIAGSQDDLCDLVVLRRLAAELPGAPTIRVVGLDHFFSGQHREMAEAIGAILAANDE